MDNMLLPHGWSETLLGLSHLPVIVKSLEKVHDTTWSMDENIHDSYEMVYMKKGSATFTISGQAAELSPHTIAIIKPHQWHKFTVTSSSCEFIVLSFVFNDVKNKSADDAGIGDFIDNIKELDNSPFILLSPGPKNEILSVLRKILRERDKKDAWDDFLIYLLSLELFVHISRTIKQEVSENTRYKSMNLAESMNAAKEYIMQNYDKELTLKDVARYVYLSESYFAHSFKDTFGISPKSYILKVRIEAAKEFLAKTDMKISDVAISVGFLSQQRFNDIFKKMEDITPLRYRKQYKKSIVNKVTN